MFIQNALGTSPYYRGKAFRPAFAKIGGLRALAQAPFMALTATASPETQEVIMKSLHLVRPVVVSQRLDRPNIHLSAGPIKTMTCKSSAVS